MTTRKVRRAIETIAFRQAAGTLSIASQPTIPADPLWAIRLQSVLESVFCLIEQFQFGQNERMERFDLGSMLIRSCLRQVEVARDRLDKLQQFFATFGNCSIGVIVIATHNL